MRDKFFRLKIQTLLDKLPVPITFNEAQWAIVKGLNENMIIITLIRNRYGGRINDDENET